MLSNQAVIDLAAELEFIENKLEHARACLIEKEYEDAGWYLRVALHSIAATLNKPRWEEEDKP